jgi:hypothetical protein
MPRTKRSPLWSDPRQKPLPGAAEIHWGHPLALALEVCAPLTEGAGLPREWVSGRRFTLGAGTLGWVPGRSGPALNFDDSTWYSVATARSLNKPITLLAWASPRAGSAPFVAGGDAYLSLRDVASAFECLDIMFGFTATSPSNTTTTTAGELHDLAGDHAQANPGGGPVENIYSTPGRWHLIGGTFETATLRKSWWNGKLNAQNTVSRSANALIWCYLGAHHGTSGSPSALADGRIDSAFVWSRVLTDDEMAWLYVEPFAFLRAIIRRRVFAPSGAVSIRKPPGALVGVM